jgi:hypothetical protein
MREKEKAPLFDGGTWHLTVVWYGVWPACILFTAGIFLFFLSAVYTYVYLYCV